MKRLGFLSFAVISACSVGVHSATGQAYSCAAPNASATVGLQDYMVRLTGGDPTLVKKRQGYQLPAVPASQVQVVKTKSVCQTAAQAYHRAVRGSSAPQISRTVVVIKVGSTRYVVQDPGELEGEFQVTVIFDSSFTPMVSFNG